MKKNLLFVSTILVTGILNAQVAKKLSKIPTHLANIIATDGEKKIGDDAPGFMLQTAINNDKKIVANHVSKTVAQTETLIGDTYYDTQTNGSIRNHIVVNADGSIATAWTMEHTDDTPTYANRGTGYNYFNGSTWDVNPVARIENIRTGWGSITNTGSGKELVIAHGASTGRMDLVTRPVKGTGVWNNDINAIPTSTTGGNFWPRIISTTTGDTVYLISLTYPVASGGAMYQGLDGAIVFSRSFDGGASWNMVNSIPTGLDAASNKFRGFGGDSYAIVAKGSMVAIVAGDSDRDVVMAKSMDAGSTWVPTTVFDCPIDKWDHTVKNSDIDNDGTADTLKTNDGSFAIAIDNNNEVCVSYGAYRLLATATATNQSWSYFPVTDGLYFWKESMGASVYPNQTAVMVAGVQDIYTPGEIYLPEPATGNPFGTFGTSMTSHPTFAIDASNTIYMLYASVGDSMISLPNPEKCVRHQYIIKSCDGGANWTEPYDVVGDQGGIVYEGVFGALAARVDGNLHVVYQKDIYAGFGVGNAADAENLANLNDYVYVKIPLTDLPDPLNLMCTVGMKDQVSTIGGLNFYPNPASSNGTIEVVLNDNAKMEVTIINNVGQTVYSTTVAGNSGNNKIDVNLSNLASGLYFYQVKIGNNQAITKKFAVGK